MTEVPSPSEIRKINDLDLLDEKYQADWLDYVMKTLASFLTKNAHKLQNEEVVRYEFSDNLFGTIGSEYKPTRYGRIWSKRYPEIVKILEDKGYYCIETDFEQPVALYICLREFARIEGPERDFDYDNSYSENNAKTKPWWQFW